jgi:hypothetical protein
VTEPTDLVTAKTVLEQTEAIRLKSFLESEGIRCNILSYHDSTLDGISQDPAQAGWGEIQVLARDLERARHIIADVESSGLDSPPEGEPSP